MNTTEQLGAIRKKIVADGQLSEDEVEELRQMIFFEGMNKEKADFLFEFKDHLSKERLTTSFRTLFVDAITSFLLEDEESPGEIDDSEAKWLRAKVQSKGFVDKVDQQLFENLRRKSINFPEVLNYKSSFARAFETSLYFSRYLTLFAVAGSLLSAVALFLKGIFVVGHGLLLFFKSFSFSEAEDYEMLLAAFVSSVDIFLFAMVLVIFGMGIYELFINKIDPVERKADTRPSWLQISSIDELKSSLGKVILMVLVVSFFKHSLDIPFKSASDLLQLSIGVLLISASLYVAHKSHKK